MVVNLTIRVLLSAALIAAPVDDVRTRIQGLYSAERYEEALLLTISEYRASDGEGVFLYAGANAARELGDCLQAIMLYDRALLATDDAEAKQAIVEEIASCRKRQAEQPPEVKQAASFMLAWAEAERALEHCDAAVDTYQAVLRRQATSAERGEARSGIEACRPTDPPAPQATTLPPTPAPLVPSTEDRDRLSPALFGVGGATFAMGSGLVVGGLVLGLRAPERDELAFQDDTRSANTLIAAGSAVAAVGLGMLIAATVRRLRRRRTP